MSNGVAVYFIMILPPLFWAGNFVVGRAVSEAGAPLGLSFSRWLLALVFLLPFIIKPIWQQRKLIQNHFWGIALLSVLGISCFNSFAYIALQSTTATNALLLNSFIPIFILLISWIFFNEKVSKKQSLGVLISLLGVAVILTRFDLSVISQLSINKGDLWMLVATLDWAFYSILLKHFRPKQLSAIAFLGILVLIGTVALIPIVLLNPFNEPSIVWDSTMIKALLYISIFPSIIAYLAWNYGMKEIGAAKGGQFIYLMPFIGAILAILFLGESIKLFHIIGGLCIALGLWLSLSKEKSMKLTN